MEYKYKTGSRGFSLITAPGKLNKAYRPALF